MTQTANSRLRSLVYTLGMVFLLLATLLAFNSLGGPALAAAQTCSWSGTWSVRGVKVTLMQTGNQVTGDDGNRDQLSGTVSGSRLTGRWTHGGGFGEIALTMNSSCNSFTGSFGSNNFSGTGNPLADPNYNGTRTSGSPPAVATPAPPNQPPPNQPPASQPPTSQPPATGAATELGRADFAGYCVAQGYDTGSLYDDGSGYCVLLDPLGFGFDLAVSIDDLDAVCQWQFPQPNAVARQRVAGDATSWRCLSRAAAL